jgi:hypothetical protein
VSIANPHKLNKIIWDLLERPLPICTAWKYCITISYDNADLIANV